MYLLDCRAVSGVNVGGVKGSLFGLNDLLSRGNHWSYAGLEFVNPVDSTAKNSNFHEINSAIVERLQWKRIHIDSLALFLAIIGVVTANFGLKEASTAGVSLLLFIMPIVGIYYAVVRFRTIVE